MISLTAEHSGTSLASIPTNSTVPCLEMSSGTGDRGHRTVTGKTNDESLTMGVKFLD